MADANGWDIAEDIADVAEDLGDIPVVGGVFSAIGKSTKLVTKAGRAAETAAKKAKRKARKAKHHKRKAAKAKGKAHGPVQGKPFFAAAQSDGTETPSAPSANGPSKGVLIGGAILAAGAAFALSRKK
jgi:hypothetical protein